MSNAYVLRQGRELRFSPRWDVESLVFDANTSDIFVLPALGRLILESLQEAGAMDVQSIANAIGNDPSVVDVESHEMVSEMLIQLANCQLVEPLCVDCCGSNPH